MSCNRIHERSHKSISNIRTEGTVILFHTQRHCINWRIDANKSENKKKCTKSTICTAHRHSLFFFFVCWIRCHSFIMYTMCAVHAFIYYANGEEISKRIVQNFYILWRDGFIKLPRNMVGTEWFPNYLCNPLQCWRFEQHDSALHTFNVLYYLYSSSTKKTLLGLGFSSKHHIWIHG